MVERPFIVPLTESLWDELRRKMQTVEGVPSWIVAVCSKPFSEVVSWPVELETDGITKPELWCSNRASYLNSAESTTFIRSAGKEAVDYQRKLAAIRQLTCENIITLQVTKRDQMFYCLFDESTHEPAHSFHVDGQFIKYPRWKDILLAWRSIVAIVLLLTLTTYIIAYLTAPTFDGAYVIVAVSLLVFFLIVFKYGSGHIIEAAIPAFIVALLGGLLIGPLAHAKQHGHEIQSQQQLNDGNPQK